MAILLLAAGTSRRLGRPKQLVEIDGEPLLRRTCRVIGEAATAELFVVTGAYRQEVQPLLAGHDCTEIYHADWAEGMGSSIGAGMQYLLAQRPQLARVLIAVCDQPALSEDVVRAVWQRQAGEPDRIVRCRYRMGAGPPVCFGQQYFSQLAALTGEEGAQSIIQQYASQVQEIDFPLGDWDIDTPEDIIKFA